MEKVFNGFLYLKNEIEYYLYLYLYICNKAYFIHDYIVYM